MANFVSLSTCMDCAPVPGVWEQATKVWDQMRIISEREFQMAADDAGCLEPIGNDTEAQEIMADVPVISLKDANPAEKSLVLPRPVDRAPEEPSLNEAATRLFDVAVALSVLVLLLPAMTMIALFMALTEKGPVLFAHRRIGKDGKPFNCLKFRTMCVDADERLAKLLSEDEAVLREWTDTQKLLEDPRVTRFGRLMRNTSLDELPQLVNVIRGDMSLVGPRPVIEEELARYGRYARYYCSVKPGLTGLWQVTRNERTTYRRRVATDAYYVRRKSLPYDCSIMLATVPAVLTGNG